MGGEKGEGNLDIQIYGFVGFEEQKPVRNDQFLVHNPRSAALGSDVHQDVVGSKTD